MIMFMKKLSAVILSLGILSACSMGAFASTVTGSGSSSGDPNGMSGSVNIDFSLTTRFNPGSVPTAVSMMEFNNFSGSKVECYIQTVVYQNDPVAPTFGEINSNVFSEGNGMMACVNTCNVVNPPLVDHITSTFHYNSSAHGSFTGGLTKYGFDK